MMQKRWLEPASPDHAESGLIYQRLCISPALVKDVPTVFHYTTLAGLTGILGTNTLWATHFADLNDRLEAIYLKQPLLRELGQRLSRRMRRRGLDLAPTAYSTVLLPAWLDEIYEILLNTPNHVLSSTPYISSFCYHLKEYEIQNGLLSQWRGYGAGGGCAIVFNLSELAKLLALESQKRMYTYQHIGPVIYDRPREKGPAALTQLVNKLARIIQADLTGRAADDYHDYLKDILELATLFKHQSFREENEVRIVASPASEHLRTMVAHEEPKAALPPLVVEKVRDVNGRTRRHIELFSGGAPLPIQRIIVGPARDQTGLESAIRQVAGDRAPITLSETPYVE
jgi:hypothetical protein